MNHQEAQVMLEISIFHKSLDLTLHVVDACRTELDITEGFLQLDAPETQSVTEINNQLENCSNLFNEVYRDHEQIITEQLIEHFQDDDFERVNRVTKAKNILYNAFTSDFLRRNIGVK